MLEVDEDNYYNSKLKPIDETISIFINNEGITINKEELKYSIRETLSEGKYYLRIEDDKVLMVIMNEKVMITKGGNCTKKIPESISTRYSSYFL